MRTVAAALLVSASFLGTAAAQSNWNKSYNVSGRPILQVEVDDASVRTHACGGCRTVSIQIDYRGSDPSRWSVSEMQGGNGIHFSLKHKPEMRMFGGWHGHSPEITIETPSETDLSLRAGDGSLTLAGLRGAIDAHTGDGSIAADNLSGSLRLTSGDGSVQLRNAEGSLYATTGDGSMTLEGRFNQIEARSGDGSIQVNLAPGSQLQNRGRISTGDGSIAMRVPHDLRFELDASSGDGAISCNLPMMTTSSTNNRHSVHGSINGGGPLLQLHSGDGSISISGS